MVMAPGNFSETKAAPFAGRRGVLVSAVKLDVLDGVAQTELVYTCATRSVTVYIHYW